MKRVILVALVLSMIMAVPAMAQEITTPEQIIKEETFNSGEEHLQTEFANSEKWRAGIYVDYLGGVVYNLEEVARINKEVVTNYTELAKVNPYYARFIPDAIKDYEKALYNIEYYKLYRKAVQTDFKVRYNY